MQKIYSMTFSEIGLNKNIQKAITDLGFDTPTPIQQESIPYLLENKKQKRRLADGLRRRRLRGGLADPRRPL